MTSRTTIIISACLLGEACRYDGVERGDERVMALVTEWRSSGGAVSAVCPEVLGGLSTPRPPAELRGGDGHCVLAGQASVEVCANGADVTTAFVRGAQLAAADIDTCQLAILKARSPSCGVGYTNIDGRTTPGDGVFTALLKQRSIPCFSDEEMPVAALQAGFTVTKGAI